MREPQPSAGKDPGRSRALRLPPPRRKRSITERALERKAGQPARSRSKPLLRLDADGVLEITYPRKGDDGGDLTISLQFLNALPKLAEPLARALTRVMSARKSRKTIEITVKKLREWCEFLAKKDAGVAPHEVTRDHLIAFRRYLDERAQTHHRSIKARATFIRAVQNLLLATGQCTNLEILKNPYPGAHLATTPRSAPPAEDLRRILVAALQEVREVMRLHEAFSNQEDSLWQDERYSDLLFAASQLHSRFGFAPPDGQAFLAMIPKRRRGAGCRRAAEVYAPSLRAFAPFAILLMLLLRLDGQMLCDLRTANIKRISPLAIDRLEVRAWRARVKSWKRRTPIVSDEVHNPARLLLFVLQWTQGLRSSSAKTIDEDRAFVMLGRHAGQPVIKLNIKTLNNAIARFCDDHDLPKITTSLPRKSAIDIADLLSGSDPAIRAQAGDHSVAVSHQHYRSAEADERGEEALAAGMMVMHSVRTRRPPGADPRDYLPDEDIMAATPGWDCSDPLDSPVPGQVRGEPCTAYGMCPACDNGAPDLKSPYSCKRTHLILDAIERSQKNMPPEVWEGSWAPVAGELRDRHIPAFHADPAVVAAAEKIDIPPMMEVVLGDDD